MAESKEFELSLKTCILVTSKGKTSDRPYAALCKRKEVGGPRRWFYMGLNNLLEILNVLVNIQVLLKRDTVQEQRLRLDHNRSITVSTYLGKKYVGFVRTGQKSSRMNITVEEFKELLKCKEEVKTYTKAIMNKKQTMVADSQDNPVEQAVELHKWGYFNTENGEMVKEADHWYFDHETCNIAGIAAEPSIDLLPISRAPELFTFSSNHDVPEQRVMVNQAFIYVLKQYIERLRDKNCHACMQNIPLVNSMHDDGCCMDWEDAVQKYMEVAILHEPQKDVYRICDYIMSKIKTGDKLNVQISLAVKPKAMEVEHWRANLRGYQVIYQAADEASEKS